MATATATKNISLGQLRSLVGDHQFGKIELPKRMVWTSSSLKLFRKCKRKFFWKYIVRLRPRYSSGPLLIGTAFHEALAQWYMKPRADMAKIAARQGKEARDKFTASAEYFDEEELDKHGAVMQTIEGMLLGYADIYSADRTGWKFDRRDVEVKFDIDCGPFDFQGKVDLIYQDGKRDVIVEHKTARKIDSSYVDRLPMDTQVRAYVFGATRGLGRNPKEVLYDVVRKCGLRRKAKETASEFNARIALDYASRPGFYFFREPLKFSKDDIANFEYEMHQTHSEFMAIINGPDPTNPRAWAPNDGTCTEFFSTCPYMPLCSTSLDKGTGMMFDQDDAMHEELAED